MAAGLAVELAAGVDLQCGLVGGEQGGELAVRTDGDGLVTGTLTFLPTAVLKVNGKITPVAGERPASVELIGEGGGSVNRIKGWFVPGSDHVVGTTVVTANDMLKQPNGTLGPFVLFPLKEA